MKNSSELKMKFKLLKMEMQAILEKGSLASQSFCFKESFL